MAKNPRPSVRVLVVDDYEPFRRFICSTLQKRPELQVIAEASDGLEAVQKAEELNPDLILLDIGLPKLNGIEASLRISRVVPATKIIFVTQNNDAETVQAALSNGASGYVLKVDANNELLPAVEAVLQGDLFISTRVKHGGGLTCGLKRTIGGSWQKSQTGLWPHRVGSAISVPFTQPHAWNRFPA